MFDFDVAVVGLGHAGCEAALAAARMGCRTVGITLRRDRIAMMSCNPAIGGTAKGHLVRELDALGGEMGRVADAAGTHFKVLNASKGPAVQARRVLCDRDAYAEGMRTVLESTAGLTLIEAQVASIEVEGRAGERRAGERGDHEGVDEVVGVTLEGGERLRVRAVIVTTGTFLKAVMHVGERQESGGRLGDAAATGLSGSLRGLGLELGRFKTGTPPRLLRGSIDYGRCTPQPGDARALPFATRTSLACEAGAPFPLRPQVHCHVTHTTARTHEILRDSLHRSPLHQGVVKGQGPRYCPSVEDKVVRFPSRGRHTVFLEPEAAGSELVYPAGLSTSLPSDVQESFLRTIPGLEQVEIARYGYAVEYDFVLSTQLTASLESRAHRGLFLAGQLNGTSGYEEAAFQGLMAGINAVARVRGEPPLVLQRREAHGAVLIDDLVSLGVDEPYRMLTSRSEHRLLLREGNADLRLREYGWARGLVDEAEWRWTQRRREAIELELERLREAGLATRMRRPEQSYERFVAEGNGREALRGHVGDEVEVILKYEGYVAQQERAAGRGREAFDGWELPAALDFGAIRGLSNEAIDRLERLRPATVGHARRLPGVTPAAIGLLLVHLRRLRG